MSTSNNARQPGCDNREQPPLWTTKELEIVRRHANQGASVIASVIRETLHRDRSERAIRQRAHRMRITLRRRGYRGGIVLGQPRGESWVRSEPVLRARILAGELDVTLAEQRIHDDMSGISLCPSCGKRPQRNDRTGLCGVCHRLMLAQQLEEQAAEAEAQRVYDSVKQRVHRTSKTCIEPGCNHVANGTGGRCYTHARLAKRGML